MKYSCCFLILFFIAAKLQAQVSTENFDSLAIVKPKKGKTHYEVATSPLSDIDLKWKRPRRSPHTVGQMAGDASRNILTSLLGGSISTSQDIDWQLISLLDTGTDSLDWELQLFCAGELEKESHRVRNSDGSHSLEKEKTAHLFWEKGVSGLILKKDDTIARFAVHVNDIEDSSFIAEARLIFSERDIRPADPWSSHFTGANYHLKGSFQGREIVVLYNGDAHKAWIYLERKLVCVFQADDEPQGTTSVVVLGKKYRPPPRLKPYLLFDKTTPQIECVRLGMISRMIEEAVSRNTWEY